MKIKDTKYLYASARIRALETRLINREITERMLEAETGEDAAKILIELGYSELGENPRANLEKALSAERVRTFSLLKEISPNPEILPVFEMKYDYHNVKALLKSAAVGQSADHLLAEGGRIPPKALTSALAEMDLSSLPPVMADATAIARDTLARTKDPQLSDFILDRAYFAEMHECAKKSGSEFLMDYVALLTDVANLRCAVRAKRQSKSIDFISSAFLSGGNISEDKLISHLLSGDDISLLFSGTLAENAAAAGSSALSGNTSFAVFERLCDDTVTAFLQSARYTPFGDAPVIAYLAAKENEITLIRIILSAKLHNQDAAEIRERLRLSYV